MNLNDIVDDLDYDEIFARGGANCGEEEFDLVKCPHCGWIYMIECEAFTVYVNPHNLKEYGDLIGLHFECLKCGGNFPEDAWSGPKATVDLTVTWAELARSPWHWVAPERVAALLDWPPRPPRTVSTESPDSHSDATSCGMEIESGHGISFPGYLHESILASALQQKRKTGRYPEVDNELRKGLILAFQSPSITDAVQELSKQIEKWRNQAFTVEDPVKLSRITQTERLAEPEINFDPAVADAVAELDAKKRNLFLNIKGIMLMGAKMAGVEIVGPLDPLYVWCLNVAISLIAHDVPAETFEQFISSYMQNLYGSNTMEIVKLAGSIPQTLPPDADVSFLAQDFGLLARLLEELTRTNAGRSSYGRNVVPVFNHLTQQMYKIALGSVLTSQDSALVAEIVSLYHGKAVFPKGAQKLDNARYYASMLGCRGQLDEANQQYDECLRFAQMPEFAEQMTPVWSTKFFSNRAETALDEGRPAKSKEYLEAASAEASKLQPLLEKNNQQAAEAINMYAHALLRIEDHALAEENFLASQKVFSTINPPFWGDHTTICLAELARIKGNLSQAIEATDGAMTKISAFLHPRESYWLIANHYRARMAADQGDVSRARDLYASCCELKCIMQGAIDTTHKLLEEYATFLEKHKLEDDAVVVRKRIETLFAHKE